MECRGDKSGAGGDFPAGSPLSAVSDNTLSARTLLSTQHIYTPATAEERGHEGQRPPPANTPSCSLMERWLFQRNREIFCEQKLLVQYFFNVQVLTIFPTKSLNNVSGIIFFLSTDLMKSSKAVMNKPHLKRIVIISESHCCTGCHVPPLHKLCSLY